MKARMLSTCASVAVSAIFLPFAKPSAAVEFVCCGLYMCLSSLARLPSLDCSAAQACDSGVFAMFDNGDGLVFDAVRCVC